MPPGPAKRPRLKGTVRDPGRYGVRFTAEKPLGDPDAVLAISDEGITPVMIGIGRRLDMLGVVTISGNRVRCGLSDWVAFDMGPDTNSAVLQMLIDDPQHPRIAIRDGLFAVLVGRQLRVWSVIDGQQVFEVQIVPADGEKLAVAFDPSWKSPVAVIMRKDGEILAFPLQQGPVRPLTLSPEISANVAFDVSLCWLSHRGQCLLCSVFPGFVWLFNVHDNKGPLMYRAMSALAGVEPALLHFTSAKEGAAQRRHSATWDGEVSDTGASDQWKIDAAEIGRLQLESGSASVRSAEVKSKHISIALKTVARTWLLTVLCPELDGYFSMTMMAPDGGCVSALTALEPKASKPSRGKVTGMCTIIDPGCMTPVATAVAHLDGTISIFDDTSVYSEQFDEVKGAASVKLLASRCGAMVYVVFSGKLIVLFRSRLCASRPR